MGGKSNQIKVFAACVITAAFIWLMDAVNTGVHTVRINYPVRFVYDDSLYLAPESLPATVPVDVSGKGWRLLSRYLRSFSASPVLYTVSNPLKVSGIDSTRIREEISRQFEGFQVRLAAQEWRDDLKFELKAYKVVYLAVDSTGIGIQPGYAITSLINMSPSLVSVEGPSPAVRNFPDSIVIRIPERGIRANYESNLPINAPQVPSVRLSHESVYISFEVSQI